MPGEHRLDSPPSAKGKISIVIPCFNQGELLLETLASIERFRNNSLNEVIIVNDGSTDLTTYQILCELDANRYTVLHQPNEGLGKARNTGIEIATSEFILPVDSDNLIRSAYLDRGVALLIKNPDLGIVYGDAEYFGERTGRWRVAEFDLISMVKENFIDACALYRKCVWESVGGYDEKMPRMGWEDWDYWMRVALRGWRFMHLDEIAFDYRVRQNSMINDTNRHTRELSAYIFNKPGNDVLKALKSQGEEIEQLLRIRDSLDYRVGRLILSPVRKTRRLLSGLRH